MKVGSILKGIIVIVIAVLLLNVLVTFLGNYLSPEDPSDKEDQNGEIIVFSVTIPSHTPDLDSIFLHIEIQSFLMEQVSDNIYQTSINFSEYPYSTQEEFEYGYSRGGDFIFAEEGLYVTPEGEFVFPRSITLLDQIMVNDTVSAWKWFPESPNDDPSKITIPSLVNSTTITPRSDFWYGVKFVDYWSEFWQYQYNATIADLNEHGYKWIGLAPPWDVLQEDPPIIARGEGPSYPDRELREHIRVFKKAGYNVYLEPQICCSPIDATNRDAQWWDTWFDEVEDYVRYHANLSREEQVDTLIIASHGTTGLPNDDKTPSHANASARWSEILDIAKSSNAPVSFHLNAWGADFPETDILAWPGYAIDFFDELDFVAASLGTTITSEINPSQEDIDKGLDIIFERFDYMYNETGLPLVIPTVAYESNNQSAMENPSELYYFHNDPENAPYEYNGTQQAMIYEGMMRQIAPREYIIGMFPGGTWYVNAPHSLEFSIRGKMAENLLSQWIAKFSSTTIPSHSSTRGTGPNIGTIAISMDPNSSRLQFQQQRMLVIDRKYVWDIEG